MNKSTPDSKNRWVNLKAQYIHGTLSCGNRVGSVSKTFLRLKLCERVKCLKRSSMMSGRTNHVSYNQGYAPLGELRELKQECFSWILYSHSIIVITFWNNFENVEYHLETSIPFRFQLSLPICLNIDTGEKGPFPT